MTSEPFTSFVLLQLLKRLGELGTLGLGSSIETAITTSTLHLIDVKLWTRAVVSWGLMSLKFSRCHVPTLIHNRVNT